MTVEAGYQPLANAQDLHIWRPEVNAAPQDGKVQEVARRSFCAALKDVAEGLWNSKIFRAVVLTAAALVAVFFLVSNPVGWMVSGVITLAIAKAIFFGGGALLGTAVLLGAQCPAGGSDKLKFELGFLKRRNNFDEIIQVGDHKLFLGALPNRFANGFAAGEAEVRGGAVLSINSPWERENRGLSLAYKPDHWTHELNAVYGEIDVPDHTLLNPEQLDKAADFIHNQLQRGNVYVHCKAGQSRSAAAIAAYLMKYGRKADNQPYTIEDVCKLIQQQRPKARLVHKISSLVAYDDQLVRQHFDRPARSQALTNAVEYLDQHPGKDLPKARVRELLG